MPTEEAVVEMTEYRLILVLPDSRKILAIDDVDGYGLPSISIPQRRRPAEQLREAIRSAWKLCVLILEFLDGSPVGAVAEVFNPVHLVGLKAVSLDQLQKPDLSEQQRTQVASILAGGSNASSPFSRIGWIDEAIRWLESVTEKKLSSKRDIVQYNAGGSFALVRFRMGDDSDYWLKATGQPNAHELSMTTLLSKLCGNCLPEVISSRPEWNAWLTQGESTSLKEIPTSPLRLFILLKDAVECMATIQTRTQGHRLDLLQAGAFDQRLPVFQQRGTELFEYIEEAMSLQVSTNVPKLEKKRIYELRVVFEEVCQRAEHLGTPDAIVHGDLNPGNILTGFGQCQFLDWSEAYLGHTLVALQHLLLLNKTNDLEVRDLINLLLKECYLDVWSETCDPSSLRKGFVYMPIIAIGSTLYGRGSWLLNSSERTDPHRQSYARSLARHMDRAARAPELREALCR